MSMFTTMKNNLNNSSLYLFVIIVVIAILSVYYQVTEYQGVFAEFPLMYYLNAQPFTVADWIARYDPTAMDMGWYRPSAFFLYHKILSQFIGWHDIFGWQMWGMFSLILLSISIAFFCYQLFPQNKSIYILVPALSVINPAFFINVSDLLAFDIWYQILILLTAGIFIGRLIENKYFMGVAIALYVLAITFKEQAIVLPLFCWMFIGVGMVTKLWIIKKERLLFAIITTIVLVIYLSIRLPLLGLINQGEYRTGFNYEIIMSNIMSGLLWIFHLFVTESKTQYLISYLQYGTLENNLYGILCFTTVIGYSLYAILKRTEISSIIILWLFIITFSMMPIYNGGRIWHYALPVIGVNVIFVLALSHILRYQYFWIGILLISLSILSHRNFNREFAIRQSDAFEISTQALREPPVPKNNLTNQSLILVDTRLHRAIWHYGVGHLFKFVYQEPTLTEVSVPSKMTGLVCVMCNRANIPIFYFVFDVLTRKWINEPLLDRVPTSNDKVHITIRRQQNQISWKFLSDKEGEFFVLLNMSMLRVIKKAPAEGVYLGHVNIETFSLMQLTSNGEIILYPELPFPSVDETFDRLITVAQP